MIRLSLWLAAFPTVLPAQQATISPRLQTLLSTDSTVAVWVFGQPGTRLETLQQAVARAGGRLRRSSEWLVAVSADVAGTALPALRSEPAVRHLQPVARFIGPAPVEPMMAAPPTPAAAAEPVDSIFGASGMPIRRLNLYPLVRRGFRGQNVRIAIFDTGFETAHGVFASASIVAQRDFVFNDGVVRNQAGDTPTAHNHGTGTWALLAGNQLGTMVGIAPDASYILAKTEDVRSETRVEEDNYVAALEWADSLGAQIVSASLSYLRFDNGTGYTTAQLNGDIAVVTVAADEAARRGITIVAAVGNYGPSAQSLATPSDGDSVIAVGAVDSLGAVASFSSRGPTADGRIKPDLVAPGVAVYTATPGGFARQNGTSFSTPIVTGAAALIKQVHPAFGPMDILEALRGSGTHARSPDSNRGWGTPDASAAAIFPRGVLLTGPVDSLITSSSPGFSWAAAGVPAFAQPLRYTLLVARDSAFTSRLFDTTLAGTEVVYPRSLTPGVRLYARVDVTGADSVTARSPTRTYRVSGTTDPPPPITLLYQNFPNPFPQPGTETTCFWFDLASGGSVRMDILDLRGHLVRNIVPGTRFPPDLPAGRYGRPAPTATSGCSFDFTWDGLQENGATAPQGVYLVKLETPDGSFFKRIVFLGKP